MTNGFLMHTIQRRLRRLIIGATISLAIVSATAIETTGFLEPRFDQANLAVEKAQFLLGPSLCVESSAQQAELCESLVRRAEELLARARQAVTAAATVADGGDVAIPRH